MELLKTWEQIPGAGRMSFMFAGVAKTQQNVAVTRHREVTEMLQENSRDLESLDAAPEHFETHDGVEAGDR